MLTNIKMQHHTVTECEYEGYWLQISSGVCITVGLSGTFGGLTLNFFSKCAVEMIRNATGM